ncbi:WD40 repeat domain-containing protein [Hydrogenimonas sp.]
MRRYAALLLLLALLVQARDLQPVAVFEASGFVADFAVEEGRLYVGTDRGSVDVFDLQSGRLLFQIPLEPVQDGRGTLVPARVLSVDIRDGALLIVSIGKEGFRNIWLYRNFTLRKIAGEERKLFVKKARFAGDGKIVFGTFGSQLVLFGIEEGYEVYRSRPSESTMGDMVLSDGGREILFSDESGQIVVIDAQSGRRVARVDSKHLDNVYHLAYARGVLLSGGHDRKVGVFRKKRRPYYISTGFPVFCVGLSPDAKIGLYSSGDSQALQLFDVDTGRSTDRLVGHRAIVNQIKFIGERTLLSSERGRSLYLWRLDQ